MDNKLFLIEVLVSDINFEPTFTPVPKKKILINIRFSEIMNMDIDPEEYELPEKPDDTSSTVLYNMGKTYLFSYNSQDLIKELNKNPLELSLNISRKEEGACLLPWKKEFSEMVKIFESIGVVKSVDFCGPVDLVSRAGKIGTINIFVRMSCFGDHVETGYVKMDDEWIFVNPKTMKMFTCANYDPGEIDVMPVGVIYNPVLNPHTNATEVSWTELFGNPQLNKRSTTPNIDDAESMAGNTLVEILSQSSAFDVVSMVFRPAENKFFDFLNMVSAEVNTKQDETMVTLKVDKPSTLGVSEQSGPSDTLKQPVDSLLELTADKIERKLCKNLDCPAVKKFKEFGIGPLATGKGLGTLYGDVAPPVNYGLSHTYGTMEKYGPYGVFTRPKSPDQPYVPPNSPRCSNHGSKKDCNICSCEERVVKLRRAAKPKPDTRLSTQPGCGCSCPCQRIHGARQGQVMLSCHGEDAAKEGVIRLRGGGGCFDGCSREPGRFNYNNPRISFDNISTNLKKFGDGRGKRRVSNKTRLTRKTGKTSLQNDIAKHFSRYCDQGSNSYICQCRLRAGGSFQTDYDEIKNPLGPKSPFLECKSIMNQFDDILEAYKKALGPCGETTCPYAANLADENCKKMCDIMKQKQTDHVEQRDSVSCGSVPCDMEDCAYKEREKKAYPVGCGSAKCAYAKYKLGLVDEDAALELQFLPAAISGKCGDPKCPYPTQPELPPIHWDCPDPLPPTGVCRNPNCPLQPPALKELKCPQPRKGPCGSTDCPYALPQPCDMPTCPFRHIPCPFLEQQKDASKSQSGEICDNPACPFTRENRSNNQANEDDLQLKGELTSCANPNCPFRQIKYQPQNSKFCGDPKCPLEQAKYEKDVAKSNTNGSLSKSKRANVCGNPNCPLALSKYGTKNSSVAGGACNNPNCPFADNNSCDDTSCPYAKKKSDEPKVCDNPNCPFAPKSFVAKGICDNPKCPFIQKELKNIQVCDNPSCPFAKKTNSSGVVNGTGSGDADDSEQCPKEAADCEENEATCDNPDCPFAKAKSSSETCTDPKCPYFQPLPSCGIPGCPYEPVPLIFCPSPNCPYSSRPNEDDYKNQSETKIVETEKEGDCENEDCDNEECEGYRGTIAGTGDVGAADGVKQSAEPGRGGTKESKRKRKKRGMFVYTMGDRYPGVKVGHRECVTPEFNVPPTMGWLWNIFTPMLQMKPRHGWKPGAVQKTIARRIRAHRHAKGLGVLKLPQFPKDESGVGDDAVDVKPRPTLHIQKKEGAYWITMNPLKDPKTLVDNEDPYIECSPMQFRITKKPKKDDDGSCECTDEANTSSSSSDSELDIEFTPPAGIINPERFKKKKNVTHCDTQYDTEDFEPKKPAKEEKTEPKGKKGKGEKGKGGKGDKKKKKGKK